MTTRTLRSTPARLHGRDHVVFPDLDRRHRDVGAPYSYALQVTPTIITILLDGFYLPEPQRRQLGEDYAAYVEAWLAEGGAGFPRAGVMYGPDPWDSVVLTVKRQDGPEWIKRVRDLAPFVFKPRPFLRVGGAS